MLPVTARAMNDRWSTRDTVVARMVRDVRQRRKIGRENALKHVYRLLERAGFPEGGVPLGDFAMERRLDGAGAGREGMRP